MNTSKDIEYIDQYYVIEPEVYDNIVRELDQGLAEE